MIEICSLISVVDRFNLCSIEEGAIKRSELVGIFLLSKLSSSLEVGFIILSKSKLLFVFDFQCLPQYLA